MVQKKSINFLNRTCSVHSTAFSSAKAPKRKKIKKTPAEETVEETPNNNEAADDNASVMPNPPPSKRQKKRQKREQISIRSKDKEVEKSITYLTKWDTARDEWKYEKLRQIHIQKNIFDSSVVPDEHIDVAIRYLSTSKVRPETIQIKGHFVSDLSFIFAYFVCLMNVTIVF